jgi:hypothetical protein
MSRTFARSPRCAKKHNKAVCACAPGASLARESSCVACRTAAGKRVRTACARRVVYEIECWTGTSTGTPVAVCTPFPSTSHKRIHDSPSAATAIAGAVVVLVVVVAVGPVTHLHEERTPHETVPRADDASPPFPHNPAANSTPTSSLAPPQDAVNAGPVQSGPAWEATTPGRAVAWRRRGDGGGGGGVGRAPWARLCPGCAGERRGRGRRPGARCVLRVREDREQTPAQALTHVYARERERVRGRHRVCFEVVYERFELGCSRGWDAGWSLEREAYGRASAVKGLDKTG